MRFRISPTLLMMIAVLLPIQSAADGEDVLMQQAVRTFVKETGLQVVGIGSWTGGKNKYKPGVSDHDMRLLLPDTVRPKEARRQWVEARKKLSAQISKTFKANGASAKKLDGVLALTNFYPPAEMMGRVPDMDKAWVVFKQANAFPNLAAKPDKAKIAAAEGIYGDGAKFWRQDYEASHGNWFYRSSTGDVIEGSMETVHAAERVAAETMSGRANVASQWIEHAWDTLREGRDAETVGKYLQRMGQDLDETMKLGNLNGRPGWLAESRALGRHLQKYPSSLERHEELVRSLLKKGHEESAIASEFARSGPAKRRFLRAMHASCGSGGSCLITRLIKRAKAVGRKMTFGQAAALASFAMDAKAAASAETEEELAKEIYTSLAWTGGWPIGLLSYAVEAGREEAEAFGIATVAQFQDVWNMMGGIYSSSGRAKVDTVSWPLERLVAEIHDEQKLQDRVATMARRASMRGFGARSGERDAALAERLFEKAWPVVAQAWTDRRAFLRQQIGVELRKLKATPLQLSQTPYPATIEPDTVKAGAKKWLPVDVSVSLSGPDKRMQTAIDNVKALMMQLGESEKGNVTVSARWDGGRRGKTALDQVFQYDAPGKYPVTAAPRIFVRMVKYPKDADLNQTIDLRLGLNVWVVPPEASDKGLRTVSFSQEEEIVMKGDCKTGSYHRLGFTFPIQGGEITDFHFEYWVGIAACMKTGTGENFSLAIEDDETCTEIVQCTEFKSKSRLVSGYFDGGDGGKLHILYRAEDSDGSASAEGLTGTIWANGTLKIRAVDAEEGDAQTLSFPPF